jgi:glutaconyl-CoA/methylmalonyl-CoA decarboxylase subunit gamma
MKEKPIMKYTVKVGDKEFEVEIEDINKRPIIARVEGEEFEVRPEIGNKPVESPAAATATDVKLAPSSASPSNLSGNTLLSPLPGVVIEVFVKAGEEVEAGTTVLIIEAMKMKNKIRSVRAGKISQVLVSDGQTVAHKQPLVEFES